MMMSVSQEDADLAMRMLSETVDDLAFDPKTPEEEERLNNVLACRSIAMQAVAAYLAGKLAIQAMKPGDIPSREQIG